MVVFFKRVIRFICDYSYIAKIPLNWIYKFSQVIDGSWGFKKYWERSPKCFGNPQLFFGFREKGHFTFSYYFWLLRGFSSNTDFSKLVVESSIFFAGFKRFNFFSIFKTISWLVYDYSLVSRPTYYHTVFGSWVDFSGVDPYRGRLVILNKFFISSFSDYFSYSPKSRNFFFRSAFLAHENPNLYGYSKVSFSTPISPVFNASNFDTFQTYADFDSLYIFFLQISDDDALSFFPSHASKSLFFNSIIFPYVHNISVLAPGYSSMYTYSYAMNGRQLSNFDISFIVNGGFGSSGFFVSSGFATDRFQKVRIIILKIWSFFYHLKDCFWTVSNYYAYTLNWDLFSSSRFRDFYYDPGGVGFGRATDQNFDRVTKRIVFQMYKNLVPMSDIRLDFISGLVDNVLDWYRDLRVDFSIRNALFSNMHGELAFYPFKELVSGTLNLGTYNHLGFTRFSFDVIECFFEYELYVYVFLSEIFNFSDSADFN